MSFGIDFGANLVPFWLDFCVLGVSWSALGPSSGRLGDVRGRLAASTRGLIFSNDFGIDFLMILASFWQPSSARLGPRSRPKSGKNLTRGAPWGGSLNRPCAQIRFWKLLQRFVRDFWWFLLICGQLLVDFWSKFGWVWSFVSRFSHFFSKIVKRSFQSILYFWIHITRIYT